jgi:hypothetical protein
MNSAGHLGVEGKGKAPHWRLTELGYMAQPPTREFLRWDGVAFGSVKKRKRNPAPESRDTLSQKPGAVLPQKPGTVPEQTVLETRDIQAAWSVLETRDITSLTTPPLPMACALSQAA